MTDHRALIIQGPGRDPEVSLRALPESSLPKGDLDVRVLWSSMNYKDALAVTGQAPIVRAPFPFVPGIDLVGEILESRSPAFHAGQLVLQTGWGLGEVRFGGYAERARLESSHVVKLPANLSARDAMVVGTAGFTAMLACFALQSHGTGDGPIVVTGASGGVGSLSIAFLSRIGFEVVAATGSPAEEYLKSLGASRVLSRAEFEPGARRPLDKGRWGGAIDSVGGKTLEALLSQITTRGAVAACGLVAGAGITTTVFPFILRGIGLLGIDSNTCPMPLRVRAWDRIAQLVDPELMATLASEITLSRVPDRAASFLAGKIQGRIVVRCSS